MSTLHPQTHDKEHSHRVLRQKVQYYMAGKRKHGINWAKQLPNYARSLNNEKREELGRKSPFKLYLGRKSSELVNTGSAYGLITKTEVQEPTISDHNLHLQKTQTWTDNVKNASDRLDEWMITSHVKKHSYKLCEIGDKVYV